MQCRSGAKFVNKSGRIQRLDALQMGLGPVVIPAPPGDLHQRILTVFVEPGPDWFGQNITDIGERGDIAQHYGSCGRDGPRTNCASGTDDVTVTARDIMCQCHLVGATLLEKSSVILLTKFSGAQNNWTDPWTRANGDDCVD